MRPWPRSLFGRVALVVFAGLALAHALTFGALLRERGELSRDMMLAYLGRDVATSVAILDRLPSAERAAWLPRLARQNYGYVIGSPPAGVAANDELMRQLRGTVSAELGAARVGSMVLAAQDGKPALHLPITLSDGTPLTLWLIPPRVMVSTSTALLLLLQLAVLAAVTWWGVRLAVRPLARLAAAADAMNPGKAGPPLDAAGPREVAQAARAFNAMQQRIDEHLAERLRLLAAISHDLQTPITRMKLRAEQLVDGGLRDKLIADLDGMQSLVEEGLAYARTAQARQEPLRPVDLNALLDGIVCDAVDAGHQAELTGRHDTPLLTRVQALRRALTNLLDNALKFGGSAQVRVESTNDEVRITVCDRGPGIPAEELSKVLQPFYRIEASRNRDTGGTGLGLAIAQELATALGGRLVLVNRAEGGLAASLVLPLLQQADQPAIVAATASEGS